MNPSSLVIWMVLLWAGCAIANQSKKFCLDKHPCEHLLQYPAVEQPNAADCIISQTCNGTRAVYDFFSISHEGLEECGEFIACMAAEEAWDVCHKGKSCDTVATCTDKPSFGLDNRRCSRRALDG